MGLFDTIHFPAPIRCDNCGRKHTSVQTKALGVPGMADFWIGDVVPSPGFQTGIFTEELHCSQRCKRPATVHFTVWCGLLTGVYTDAPSAEAALLRVDRADLLNFLERHAARADRYGRLLHDLLRQVELLVEHQAKAGQQPSDDADDDWLLMLRSIRLKKHLAEQDPLGSIAREARRELEAFLREEKRQ